ncbi:MFS transporter [Gluconacetobacter tumulisoli]|uniref:MFS transporter n=2 Tax=Gluconacetobacter tumulisoli TaxID=1286189 RepID=A0A7W4K846_9PROT|nr:MFS transporter [Gluconacetobacter tumulisoli]
MMSSMLDALPLSRAHVRLLLIGGLGYLFDGLDGSSLAFFLPVLRGTWHLSGVQAGLIASSTSQGYLIGSFLSGFLADRIGRRRIMMSALALYCVASCLSALAQDWRCYFALRLVCGIGTGAEAVVIIPYIAEFLPARLRGRLCGAVVGFFSFGYVLAACLGFFVVSATPEGWRLVSVMTGLPILLLLWWRRALPESPRWLEIRGRDAEARLVLQAFAGGGACDPHPPGRPRADGGRPVGPGVWSAPWRSRVLLSVWLWTWLFFSFYGFFSWIPSLLLKRGLNLSDSFGLSLLIFAAQVPGYFVAAWLNGPLGRRRVMIGALSLAALSALLLVRAEGVAGLLAGAMGLSAGLNGAVAGLYAYTPELFPTRIRATAMGLASGISRLGAIGGAFGVGLIAAHGGTAPVFAVTGAALGLALLALFTIAPETDNSALPEEDQEAVR